MANTSPRPVALSDLPLEVLEQILESVDLSDVDVYSFGNTCFQFSELVYKFGNKIWKAKFKQMWPRLASLEIFQRHEVSNWHSEFTLRSKVAIETMKLLSEMSECYVKKEELSTSDFVPFTQIIQQISHPLALEFMIDELMLLFYKTEYCKNLTLKYYGEKVLRYLRQVQVTKAWEDFKNLPPGEQLLEHGAVIIAQWSQPCEDITNRSVGSVMDAIAKEVLQTVIIEHGEKHPAVAVPSEVSSKWRTQNLPDNYYTPLVSRQIISATSAVLFNQMGFHGDTNGYYDHKNSYINKVLENHRGIPITLSIVFESVTRRLGVKCEPVSFPGHFLLRWRDSYREDVPPQYFYIDVFNGGIFLGKGSCPQFNGSTGGGRCPMGDIFKFGPATANQVMERMAMNLEVASRQRDTLNGRAARLRSALELLHLINPLNMNCSVLLAQFYMQHNMDVSSLRSSIQQNRQFDMREWGQASYLLKQLNDYDNNYSQILQESSEKLEVKSRASINERVKFAVGLIMRHRRYSYTCVVVGWDPICSASQEWINHMNVNSLEHQHLQPFYHVLVDDGTSRYAAEENLELVEESGTSWVSHSEVGRYFKEYLIAPPHYIPNAELAQAYPDDAAVVASLLHLTDN